VQVNSSSGTASYPAVAMDENGNAAIVWRDDRNDNNDIYAQKLVPQHDEFDMFG
jgi:hypothetical protein